MASDKEIAADAGAKHDEGRRALEAGDFAGARSAFDLAGEQWASAGYHLKAIVALKDAFEIDMLDEATAGRLHEAYERLGLVDDVAVWQGHLDRLGEAASQWPFPDANAHLATMADHDGGEREVRYGGSKQALLVVTLRGEDAVECRRTQPFAFVSDPMALALLRHALGFRAVDHEVAEDEDPYEPITVDFPDRERTYLLRAGGIWDRLPPKSNAEPAPNPDDVQTLVDLGNAYLEMGLVADAKDTFAKALEAAPENAEAKAGLEKASADS